MMQQIMQEKSKSEYCDLTALSSFCRSVVPNWFQNIFFYTDPKTVPKLFIVAK